jgi:hypothetical protein
MLRIVFKLDDVVMPVRGAHQVRLGAATHASDMLNCLNGHHAILCETPAKAGVGTSAGAG